MNHQTENLYDKLNNVHATLRKQKEDAFRTKQLAEQRYAIQRADRENMEKKCAETRAKLVSLKERAVEMKNVNAALEEKNKHVKREYNFQHSELQSKKEKLSHLEARQEEEAQARNYTMSAAREMLRRNRENASKHDMGNSHGANFTAEEKRRRLELIMEEVGTEDFLRGLPELMKMQRLATEEQVRGMEIRNASLRRIIAGYQNALGGDLDGIMMMENVPTQDGGENGVLQQ